jgi:outer membrane immunogenic protein
MVTPETGLILELGYVMKHVVLSLAIAAGALLPASSALAADMDAPPPVEDLRPATYDWTGPYAGVSVSSISTFGKYGVVCPPAAPACGAGVYDPEMNGHGVAFDLHAGWNYQIDQIVIGLEGNWAFGGKVADNEEPAELTKLKFDNIAQIRARLGMAFDDTLIYAVGGAAFVDSEFSSTDYPTGSGFSAKDSKWLTGYVIGGGIEHAFSDRFSARLEYTYMGLPDADYSLDNPAYGLASVTQDFEGVHTVTLGLSYNFGW